MTDGFVVVIVVCIYLRLCWWVVTCICFVVL